MAVLRLGRCLTITVTTNAFVPSLRRQRARVRRTRTYLDVRCPGRLEILRVLWLVLVGSCLLDLDRAYWIVPVGSCLLGLDRAYWIVSIGPPQHPKHSQLSPISIPIPSGRIIDPYRIPE